MHQINAIRDELRQYLPWHGARLSFVAIFLVALFRTKKVTITELVSVMPTGRSQQTNSKRIYRFFRYFDFPPETVTTAIVKMLGIPQPWTLSLDRTNWSFGQVHINILCLGVVYRGLAIPLVWTMLPKQGNSNTDERMDLLDRFFLAFPEVQVRYLTADREFIGKEWFSYLMLSPDIPMLIRIKEDMLISSASGQTRQTARACFRDVEIGASRLLSKARFVCGRRLWVHGTRLPDNKLLILVSQKRPAAALDDYAQRWGIENLFAVLKTRGFDLEASHFTEMERLSKLLALLSLAVAWAFKSGLWLHQQKPLPLKRHGYKAQSFFRYGLDYIRQTVSNFGLHPDQFDFSLHCLRPSTAFLS